MKGTDATQQSALRKDAARNRGRIMDAARALVNDRKPLQLNAVAQAADVGVGTVYRHFPTPEARSIFEQINGVYKKVDDLTEIISKIGRGELSELRIGSVPSIAQVMVPRAIERVRRRYPDLGIDINILKIEEAIDYLMLGRGDCVGRKLCAGWCVKRALPPRA